MPLSSYTAALLANTAVPVWHEARRELPFLFTAGAAASAGAALVMLTPLAEAQPARRLAVAGAVAELAVAEAMEHRLAGLGLTGAYEDVNALNRAARVLTAAGAAMVAVRGARSRRAAIIGGALLSAGAVAERWTVFRAGSRSAQRPRDTIDPQRGRIAARDRPNASSGSAQA